MLLIMAVMVVFMIGDGHEHVGMMGHGNHVHSESSPASASMVGVPEHQH